MVSGKPARQLRVGLVVPHIFMHRDILPSVIFSPGLLALDLAAGLQMLGVQVTLFTPGPVAIQHPAPSGPPIANHTADLSYFEQELAARGDSYLDLLKKHPFTFVTLARQAQSELVARAYAMANADQLDIVHIYTNEEDIALPFARLCRKPVVLTHHDPFNFLVKYKSVFPKYSQLNWLSMSLAQRAGMPWDTNWVGNIYHGLDPKVFTPQYRPQGDYLAYLGRIIEPKGVHLAIQAVKLHNAAHPGRQYRLKIAGKHYADSTKDHYWQRHIQPQIDGRTIEYAGFIKDRTAKQEFLGNARALLVPSAFEEPFGMVMIEALACGTPVIGLDSGAIPEVIQDGKTGFVAAKTTQQTTDKKSGKPKVVIDEPQTAQAIAAALAQIGHINRRLCRADFESRFTLERMCREHLQAYQRLHSSSQL